MGDPLLSLVTGVASAQGSSTGKSAELLDSCNDEFSFHKSSYSSNVSSLRGSGEDVSRFQNWRPCCRSSPGPKKGVLPIVTI